MNKLYFIASVIFFIAISFTNCTMDKSSQVPDVSTGFPPDVAKIINTQCGIAGCHTEQSKPASGGLAMQTWDQLFQGGNGGAVCIPYRPDQSWLMYFTNTDTSKGVVLTPTMPYLRPPLSDEQWQTLYDWVAAGAPNDKDKVAFSGDPNRKKFYVANQGCDFVSVFDADSKLCMRIVDVGQDPGPGNTPHQMRFSPDGQYWYVVFVNGTVIQKFRSSDDSLVGSAEIGGGFWNTIAITPDGKYGFVVDFDGTSEIAVVDLENMVLKQTISSSDFTYLHGSWINKEGTTLYVTAQNGNHIDKFDISNLSFITFDEISLQPGYSPNNNSHLLDPHEIMMSPDESKYFVTCEWSNEVRVMDAHTDTLIKVIPVHEFPLEMAISLKYNYMFVTCENEPCGTLCEGAVDVIDLNTLEVIKSLSDGLFEPHGIGVMDDEGYAVVANRNLDVAGPAPHHVSTCGGRNGFIKLIDLATLEFVPGYRTEVGVDPYALTVRP